MRMLQIVGVLLIALSFACGEEKTKKSAAQCNENLDCMEGECDFTTNRCISVNNGTTPNNGTTTPNNGTTTPNNGTAPNGVEFDNGVYILLAQVEEPIPAVLTLISDIIVIGDGTFALVGADADEINGDAKNTRNPENLIIDTTDQGYTVYATGKLNSINGLRTLESDPFDLTVPVGPLEVQMAQVRLVADIVKNPDTGKDQIAGTLSFEKVTIRNGDSINEREGGTTALIGDFVPKALIPEGNPTLCNDNLCGAVIGKCEPPEEFPLPAICE